MRSILLLHLVVRCLETIYILSVYSPFSDRGELPLHNIPSPFPSSSSAISASTLSNHVFLGLQNGLLHSTLCSTHFFTQSS